MLTITTTHILAIGAMLIVGTILAGATIGIVISLSRKPKIDDHEIDAYHN